MERCTGRFFSRMKIAMPKPSPKTQNRSPIMSRLGPDRPRKKTQKRSGRFRAASPPASSVCASAWPTVRSSIVARAAEIVVKRFFANRRPADTRLAFQVRIKILLRILFRGHDVSDHASTARHIRNEECRFGRVGKFAQSAIRLQNEALSPAQNSRL